MTLQEVTTLARRIASDFFAHGMAAPLLGTPCDVTGRFAAVYVAHADTGDLIMAVDSEESYSTRFVSMRVSNDWTVASLN
jgi:hypothetical protein